MKGYPLWLILCAAVAVAAATPSIPASTSKKDAVPKTYGSIAVSRVVQIAPDCTIYCDIDEFPSVIGQNIPVVLEGIEPAAAESVDKNVIAFLEQTLKPQSQEAAPSIALNNLRRGRTFGLVADIEIDGKDLAQLLIEQGLARRIIRLETAEGASSPAVTEKPQVKPQAAPAVSYVAAKNSKVFHLSTCSHAKRLNPETTLTFGTRQEAEQNGRRPCKTCNP
ncbi:MAG: hypothetical protein GXY41_01805 [Phycisphaerae bacterium]|nr:hypothetical protein [Phycisphaerae bacterium]